MRVCARVRVCACMRTCECVSVCGVYVCMCVCVCCVCVYVCMCAYVCFVLTRLPASTWSLFCSNASLHIIGHQPLGNTPMIYINTSTFKTNIL